MINLMMQRFYWLLLFMVFLWKATYESRQSFSVNQELTCLIRLFLHEWSTFLAWHHSSLLHWGPWSGLIQGEERWRKVFGPAHSVQICAVVILLSLFLQLECVFCFAYKVRLKPSGQQMDKDHTKNYNNYTSSAHMAALSPSHYSPENKYTESLLYAFGEWVCL